MCFKALYVILYEVYISTLILEWRVHVTYANILLATQMFSLQRASFVAYFVPLMN